MKRPNENVMFYTSMLCGSIFFCTLMFMAYSKLESQVFCSKNCGGRNIVIDAGHGADVQYYTLIYNRNKNQD